MSTLVSILFSVVLNLLPIGAIHKDLTVAETAKVMGCQDDLQQLRPHYIVTENELLSFKN